MDRHIDQPFFMLQVQNYDQRQPRTGQQAWIAKPTWVQRQTHSEQQDSIGSATEFGDSRLSFGTATEQSSLPSNEVYDSSALTCGQFQSTERGSGNSIATFGSSCEFLPHSVSSEVQQPTCTTTGLIQGPDLRNCVELLTQDWNHGPYDRYLDLDLGVETEAYESSGRGNLQAATGDFEPSIELWAKLPFEPFSAEAAIWPAYMSPSNTTEKNGLESCNVTQYRELCPRPELSLQQAAEEHVSGTPLGPVQFEMHVPRRNKINRKTGRACLLCGLEKAKVSLSLHCLHRHVVSRL